MKNMHGGDRPADLSEAANTRENSLSKLPSVSFTSNQVRSCLNERGEGFILLSTMLEFKDFFHLPQLDPLVRQIVANGPGLVVVAGLDPRPLTTMPGEEGFLPSGRPTIFRILMRQMLMSTNASQAIIVAGSRDAIRVSRQFKRQIEFFLVRPPFTYAERIAEAVHRRPDLLVVDRLTPESITASLKAAQKGMRVLAQIDTVFRGAEVVRSLTDFGASRDHLSSLRWVVTVQRLPTLCSHCKQPTSPEPSQLSELQRRHPEVFGRERPTFFTAAGCSECNHIGRHGDVAVFDIFHANANVPDLLRHASMLSLEEYVLRLSILGHLPLEAVLRLETDQLRRTYRMLMTSEIALHETNASIERKLAELEAANRVLQQRTEALVSLQEVGQALISSNELADLSGRVCRRACDICCADLAILYYLRAPDVAEILAVSGWDPALIHRRIDSADLMVAKDEMEPISFNRLPPGISSGSANSDPPPIQAGYYLPLIAEDETVGVMIVHSTQSYRFTPGEEALLQTFANQAALAIQRAGLIEQLQGKIGELETAHSELARQERVERELELARQVQQSVLPRTFPQIPGYRFAAQNEPAREVGGDFYDVISLDVDHFGLVVGDVSDKGMPSALYMALTRSLLLAEARRELSPRDVLYSVNQLLLELGDPDMFVTVFYGVIDITSRKLTFARAGHDYPLLLRGNTVKELKGKGTILGLFDQADLHLSEEEISLAPDDWLVLYTDGLTDAMSVDGRLFDRAQLGSLLQSYDDVSPTKLCEATFAELAAFQGAVEQFDDMAMLVVAVG
jgi:serine phosphatase RsbU (regulator of sigma subunit)